MTFFTKVVVTGNLVPAIAVCLGLATDAHSHSPTVKTEVAAQTSPTENFLTPDGHFDFDAARRAGQPVSLNLAGYDMKLDRNTGEPVFVPSTASAQANPDDIYWDDRFHLYGFDGEVWVLAVDGSKLYVGGEFTHVDGVEVNNIALWNGATWSALGSGMDAGVFALCSYSGDIYAGGNFTTAGGVTVNGIATWDGAQWNAINTGGDIGLDGYCYAIVAAPPIGGMHGPLIAGGYFSEAGGVSALSIVSLSATGFQPLDGGVDGVVYALGQDPIYNDLIVGGEFGLAGADPDWVTADNICRFDGYDWHPMGDGVPFRVYALADSPLKLFAAGRTGIGVMEWTPGPEPEEDTWEVAGSGIAGHVYSLTGAVSAAGGNYAVGSFSEAGGLPAANIARWEVSDWFPLSDDGTDGVLYTVTDDLSGYDIVVGGDFLTAGGVKAGHLAGWSAGSGWTPHITSGPHGMGVGGNFGDDGISALCSFGSNVAAGGWFRSAGDSVASNIAEWDGVCWSPLGEGTDAGVKALCDHGGQLYAGGVFSHAGGVSAHHVAVWDPASGAWSDPGYSSPLNSYNCQALAEWNGTVVAGGSFSDGTGVAQLVGTSWQSMGTGPGGAVNALLDWGGTLIAGGLFPSLRGTGVLSGIAYWNGASWQNLNGGVDGTVYALTTDQNGDLIVGGKFDNAGGLPATNIARWDGLNWHALGSGTGGTTGVIALTRSGTKVYAGGYQSISSWDGAAWSDLGSGVNGVVLALCEDPTLAGLGAIYAGGNFTYAGEKPSWYIARWTEINTSCCGAQTVAPTAWAEITFSNVTSEGFTSAEVGSNCSNPPANFLIWLDICYEISTTAVFSGTIEVCITYDPAQLPVPESWLQLWHYSGGWQLTANQTIDYSTHTICGEVTSLSPFAIMIPAPECLCPYQSDFDEDEFLTALDLSSMIDILFGGDPDVQDPDCPVPRADFDCDGFSTALDLSGLIDHLFSGGDGPCDPCAK